METPFRRSTELRESQGAVDGARRQQESAFADAGDGLIELRKIEAAEEIADRMSKARNVTYLPGNQNVLLNLPQ
ncbi:hypothetical protein Y032_0043g825 [Ancylostoma ceylanicum]|uniref:Prohibitin n=1 Tax=Ancylostoma ceylanicum TaxID=53326 RepID=A0A016UER0_9BILA|nr:hypothetical protein Y032_0043g825 [Ancylostoma ceylanicum]